jgi:hypothetical protein
VRCPTGTQVTGGGVYITGSDTGTEVATTAPFDAADADSRPDDGWTAYANGSVAPQTMTTFAVCWTWDASPQVSPGAS